MVEPASGRLLSVLQSRTDSRQTTRNSGRSRTGGPRLLGGDDDLIAMDTDDLSGFQRDFPAGK